MLVVKIHSIRDYFPNTHQRRMPLTRWRKHWWTTTYPILVVLFCKLAHVRCCIFIFNNYRAVAHPANVETQDIFEIIATIQNWKNRVIGVITKCDKIEEGGDDWVRKFQSLLVPHIHILMRTAIIGSESHQER